MSRSREINIKFKELPYTFKGTGQSKIFRVDWPTGDSEELHFEPKVCSGRILSSLGMSFLFLCLPLIGWVCCVCALSRSVLSSSATPWTVTHEAPLSMGFFRQEYWCGLPCPSPGDLPNPRLNSCLLHWKAVFFLPLSPQGSPDNWAILFENESGRWGYPYTEGSYGIITSPIQRLSIQDQWFSNSSIYQNQLEGLLHGWLGFRI